MNKNESEFEILKTLDKGDQLNISEDVITAIVGVVTEEVDGVSGLCGGFTSEIVEMFGKRNASKGVKAVICDNNIIIDVSIMVKYGYSIPEIAKVIKKKVKESVEVMTGLTVMQVNLFVEGLEC